MVDQSLPLFIGGVGNGGRIASIIQSCLSKKRGKPLRQHKIDRVRSCGLLCIGYPFLKGLFKTTKTYFDHITVPFLIIQGERDGYGDFYQVK